MKKSTLSALVATVLGTVAVGNANAFTITSGNSSITGDTTGLQSWSVDGVSHLSSQTWWFNTSATGASSYEEELAYFDSSNGFTTGGSATSGSYSVLGFDIDITYSLSGGAGGSGSSSLTENVVITNNTGSQNTFSLFQFTDFDLGGYSPYDSTANNVGDGTDGFNYGQNDTVTATGNNYIQQTNGSMTATETAVNTTATSTYVGQYLALDDLMYDGMITTGGNGLTSFTGDAAWIWEYAFDLADGDSVTIAKGMTLDATVVPVPAAAWLFGSGLLGLVGIARRRV